MQYDIQDLKKIDMLLEQREKIDLIEKTLMKLKKEDIEVFNLYYYSGRKNKEISKILNISEFAVKQKIYRIRKRIKKDLEKGGYSFDE